MCFRGRAGGLVIDGVSGLWKREQKQMKPWLPAQEDGGALEGGVSGPLHIDMNVENLRPISWKKGEMWALD